MSSRTVWAQSCATCSGMTLPEQRGWTRRSTAVLPHLSHPAVCDPQEPLSARGPRAPAEPAPAARAALSAAAAAGPGPGPGPGTHGPKRGRRSRRGEEGKEKQPQVTSAATGPGSAAPPPLPARAGRAAPLRFPSFPFLFRVRRLQRGGAASRGARAAAAAASTEPPPEPPPEPAKGLLPRGSCLSCPPPGPRAEPAARRRWAGRKAGPREAPCSEITDVWI